MLQERFILRKNIVRWNLSVSSKERRPSEEDKKKIELIIKMKVHDENRAKRKKLMKR